MNYESSIYQKINRIADWVIRIIMINILMIITSIPLITLFPSLAAGYKLFYDYTHKNEVRLFSGYFTYFKTDFMRKFQIGLILIIVLLVGYYNVTYYVNVLASNENLFYQIGYYVAFAFLFAVFVVTLYTLPVVTTYPRLKLGLMMKLAFALSGKYFLRTLLLMLIHLIPFAMMLTQITSLLAVFGGLSIPMVLAVLVHEKATEYIISLGERHD